MQCGGSRMRWSVLLAVLIGLIGSLDGIAQSSSVALGGPHGVVLSSKGFPIEGVMVQLISHKTSIRTTV